MLVLLPVHPQRRRAAPSQGSAAERGRGRSSRARPPAAAGTSSPRSGRHRAARRRARPEGGRAGSRPCARRARAAAAAGAARRQPGQRLADPAAAREARTARRPRARARPRRPRRARRAGRAGSCRSRSAGGRAALTSTTIRIGRAEYPARMAVNVEPEGRRSARSAGSTRLQRAPPHAAVGARSASATRALRSGCSGRSSTRWR